MSEEREQAESLERKEEMWCLLISRPAVLPVPVIPLVFSLLVPSEDALLILAGAVLICPLALVLEISLGIRWAVVALALYLIVAFDVCFIVDREYRRFPRRGILMELLRDLLAVQTRQGRMEHAERLWTSSPPFPFL